MTIVMKNGPSFEEVGCALLSMSRIVDDGDRASFVQLLESLERLAGFDSWIISEASDDESTSLRLREWARIKLTLMRALLSSLSDPTTDAVRARLSRVAPDLLPRFDRARTVGLLKLRQGERLALFVADDPEADDDPAFELPIPETAPGASVEFKL
jgi:hypothetical protein